LNDAVFVTSCGLGVKRDWAVDERPTGRMAADKVVAHRLCQSAVFGED
jgi:hypothetical protein